MEVEQLFPDFNSILFRVLPQRPLVPRAKLGVRMRFVDQRLLHHSRAPRIDVQVLLVLRLDGIDLLLGQLLRVQWCNEELRKSVQGILELSRCNVKVVLGRIRICACIRTATVS